MSVDLEQPLIIKETQVPVRYIEKKSDGRIVVEMPVSRKRVIDVLVLEHELGNTEKEYKDMSSGENVALLTITGGFLALIWYLKRKGNGWL
ncbi:hypothetical protein HER14_19290 [Acidithiobacillus thiooxidans]|uniref:Uncharacterized protein n=2 Tax=Acidithiobacillus TaxID=119977 RepID=A0A1C2J0K5_ACITH|nr:MULTISPECIES: hypothetical protein [Acidithiobacillus]MBU2748164.1 hypothetical protein [Acidithiobacillus montserratensis]MBU2753011.1 hypothetical protein [Acidithiobacillus thiooxidans]OCX73197.1 hypothetical protein A6M23_08255 [Acidithiobacillus thiooxidans]OCX81766.1 hypothetical protein A6P08_13295 [Acidithiobacillus thiooxidans]